MDVNREAEGMCSFSRDSKQGKAEDRPTVCVLEQLHSGSGAAAHQRPKPEG